MDDRIVRAEMRRQIEARALAVAEIVSGFLERVPRHVEWDAIERALRIRDPDAIEIVDRHGPRVVRDKSRTAAVERQILFTERTQLQDNQIGVFEFVRRGAPHVSAQRSQPVDPIRPFGSA
jgi:hypothetical protein